MSATDGTSVIPPGWYPDPADDARLRRWDGQQWTQDVILAPDEAPAVGREPESASAPTPPAPTPGQPPVGQPVPASPAPTSAPPSGTTQSPAPQPTPQSAPPPPAAPQAAPPPASTPPSAAAQQPTTPNPSPSVSQHSSPASGPVSLPEWATLPGLTLPPDLSSLPGMESDSVLLPPTFAESEQRELPTLPVFEPVFEPPFIPQRPDVHDVGRTPSVQSTPQPSSPRTPAAPYAPPPMGAQYDVPPPPGMAHVPTAGPVLPPSAFVAPQLQNTGRPQLPPVASGPPAVAPLSLVGQERVRAAPQAHATRESGSGTVSSWLIGALPLFQFAAIYVVFGVLGVALAPGMQWGILAVPAAFSLLFANADKKTLTARGASSPSLIFALIPPLYLVVRCFSTGRSSVLPLVAWVVLQAGAVAGVYYLLPSVLAAAVSAIG